MLDCAGQYTNKEDNYEDEEYSGLLDSEEKEGFRSAEKHEQISDLNQ